MNGKHFAWWFAVILGLVAAGPSSAQAQPDKSSKSSYSLFQSTPRDMMRDMSTDRPDLTESPITVDAGLFAGLTDGVDDLSVFCGVSYRR